jgi:hypothetical protein
MFNVRALWDHAAAVSSSWFIFHFVQKTPFAGGERAVEWTTFAGQDAGMRTGEPPRGVSRSGGLAVALPLPHAATLAARDALLAQTLASMARGRPCGTGFVLTRLHTGWERVCLPQLCLGFPFTLPSRY